MAKTQLKPIYIRTRYCAMLNFNCPLIIDESTQVEPGKATEISDLFKQLDESGEVHSYEYTGDTPVNIHGNDFAENPTTYQGVYEQWEFGDAVREVQQMQQASEASAANAANVENSAPEKSSDA